MIRAGVLAAALVVPLLALGRAAPRRGRPASSNLPHRVAPPPARPEVRPTIPAVPGAHKPHPRDRQKLV